MRCHACDTRTHGRTVESRAVFSLSWIRKRNQNSCPSECLAVKNWCLGKTCVFQGHKGCGEGRSKLGWNSFSSQVSHLLKMKWSVLKKYREPKIFDKKNIFIFRVKDERRRREEDLHKGLRPVPHCGGWWQAQARWKLFGNSLLASNTTCVTSHQVDSTLVSCPTR